MRFTARLRSEEGNMFSGEFDAESFKTAWLDAKRAFPDHRIITIYPCDPIERIHWAWGGSDVKALKGENKRLLNENEKLHKEILGLQMSLEMVTRDRSMLLRQLNGEDGQCNP